MSEEQVRKIIQEELVAVLGVDRYMFQKNIQIFDARNIQLGKTTGTKIGTEGGASGQKIGFFDADPVTQRTGVAVSAAGIHAALVSLGLITA